MKNYLHIIPKWFSKYKIVFFQCFPINILTINITYNKLLSHQNQDPDITFVRFGETKIPTLD